MVLLVTGSSGFVGSHLTNSLISKKYSVLGLAHQKTKKSTLKTIIKDISKVQSSTFTQDLSCIIHAAAITDLKKCHDSPVESIKTNVFGTLNMLEIARKKDSKFVYVSTSHVYGVPEKIPIKEKHVTNPTSIYASSKLEGEHFCEMYSKLYGMDVSVIRLFSVYGPQSPSYNVISKIILQLLTSNVIRLGDITPKRDFIFISDVVDAIELIMKKTKDFSIFNVGSGKSLSIQDVCNMLKKISKNDAKVLSTKSNFRKNDAQNIVADISKIKKLEWKPKILIKDGLKLTFERTVI